MPKKFIPSLCERSIVQGYSSAESDLEPTEDQLPSLNHRSRGRDKQCVRYPRPHSHLFRNRFGGRTRGGRHARRQDNCKQTIKCTVFNCCLRKYSSLLDNTVSD